MRSCSGLRWGFLLVQDLALHIFFDFVKWTTYRLKCLPPLSYDGCLVEHSANEDHGSRSRRRTHEFAWLPLWLLDDLHPRDRGSHASNSERARGDGREECLRIDAGRGDRVRDDHAALGDAAHAYVGRVDALAKSRFWARVDPWAFLVNFEGVSELEPPPPTFFPLLILCECLDHLLTIFYAGHTCPQPSMSACTLNFMPNLA
eukprot:SAG11_NODE_3107_length_2684_cov_2.457640_1_plen_203_part_00